LGEGDVRAFADGALAIPDDAMEAARHEGRGGWLGPGAGGEHKEREEDGDSGGVVKEAAWAECPVTLIFEASDRCDPTPVSCASS
jgi:hypothetical protein